MSLHEHIPVAPSIRRCRGSETGTFLNQHTVSAELFSHAGDCGDLLSALPALRAASSAFGGGHLNLYPADWTRQRMSPEIVRGLAPLLEAQPYVKSIQYAESCNGVALDAWRWNRWPEGPSLADRALDLVRASRLHRNTPWLSVESKAVSRIVFARSFRYRDERFPWNELVAKYGNEAIFVGLRDEHEDFVQRWGYVPWHATSNYLSLAQTIAGAELLVVNQTSTFWVGFGLGRQTLLEEDPRADWRNCHHDVPWVTYRESIADRMLKAAASGPLDTTQKTEDEDRPVLIDIASYVAGRIVGTAAG